MLIERIYQEKSREDLKKELVNATILANGHRILAKPIFFKNITSAGIIIPRDFQYKAGGEKETVVSKEGKVSLAQVTSVGSTISTDIAVGDYIRLNPPIVPEDFLDEFLSELEGESIIAISDNFITAIIKINK